MEPTRASPGPPIRSLLRNPLRLELDNGSPNQRNAGGGVPTVGRPGHRRQVLGRGVQSRYQNVQGGGRGPSHPEGGGGEVPEGGHERSGGGGDEGQRLEVEGGGGGSGGGRRLLRPQPAGVCG